MQGVQKVFKMLLLYAEPLSCWIIYVLHSSPFFIKLTYPTSLQDFNFYKQLENSVDPDQLASEKPADLDLHGFQNRIYWAT